MLIFFFLKNIPLTRGKGVYFQSNTQPIGAVIGFVLPLPFISDSDKTNPDGKSKFQFYILIQSIIITVLGLPIMFWVRNQPPSPPSHSAEKMLRMRIESQFVSIWKLLKNRDFLMILGAFSFIFSIYVTLGATVGQLTDNFGFESSDNSVFGTVYIITGLVGSFAHAIPLDIFQFYKYQYILIGVLWVLSSIATTLALGYGELWSAWIALAFLGAAQLPIIGVSYSFAAEVTFPINEAHSWGFLQLVGSLIASVIAAVVGMLLDDKEKYAAWYVTIGAVVIGSIFTVFTRDKLHKTLAGRKGSSFSLSATVPLDMSRNDNDD